MKTLREFKEFLDEYDIQIAWINKTTLGAISYDAKIVFLNLYLLVGEIVIHEFLHYKYPELTEKAIDEMTNTKIERLTIKELRKIVDYALKRAIR